jgi:hypothetical protein
MITTVMIKYPKNNVKPQKNIKFLNIKAAAHWTLLGLSPLFEF